MIRASVGDRGYWDRSVAFFVEAQEKAARFRGGMPGNPTYAGEFWFDEARYALRFLLVRYSRGDSVANLNDSIAAVLDSWELSNKLSAEICSATKLHSCRSWTFDLADLNHYNWCFWLVGLALALEIPADQWGRLLVLIDGEGRDVLLDRVIASREPGRKIGHELLHPKPYARLLKAIDAPKVKQAQLLRDFVDHWYPELARNGKDGLWWYIFGDPVKNPLEMGSYFGRWCIEAVAAVKAFGLDDGLCLGHEHYPGDLLRPNGPTTHPARVKQGLVGKLLPWLR